MLCGRLLHVMQTCSMVKSEENRDVHGKSEEAVCRHAVRMHDSPLLLV